MGSIHTRRVHHGGAMALSCSTIGCNYPSNRLRCCAERCPASRMGCNLLCSANTPHGAWPDVRSRPLLAMRLYRALVSTPPTCLWGSAPSSAAISALSIVVDCATAGRLLPWRLWADFWRVRGLLRIGCAAGMLARFCCREAIGPADPRVALVLAIGSPVRGAITLSVGLTRGHGFRRS